jgi:hypothetical protein
MYLEIITIIIIIIIIIARYLRNSVLTRLFHRNLATYGTKRIRNLIRN